MGGSLRQRVLHLHTLPVVSGSGLNTLASIRRLRDHGFDCALACGPTVEGDPAGPSLIDLAREMGIPVHPVAHLTRAISPRRDLLALAGILETLRRGSFDIVHTHNSKAGLLGRAAARLARVPAVIHTVHGWAFDQESSPGRRALYRWIERGAAPLADRTLLVSEALEASARAAGIPGRRRRRVVHSGIDRGAFLAARRDARRRAALGADEGTFLVGQVSKLWEGKGHATLLEAFDRLLRVRPAGRLVLIGDGPLRASLEVTVRRLRLAARVRFLGHRVDVAALTAQLDAATLCSAYEGMGRVVLEAMAAGVPVVASRVGGITELVAEGRTGFLVPSGDAAALAARLGRLAAEPALRRRMGGAGRARADARFDEERMAARIAAVYREALAGSAPRASGAAPAAVLLGRKPCT